MLNFRVINPVTLFIPCLILSLSGCQMMTQSKSNTPPTPRTQNRYPLRLPFPFLPRSSKPTPAEPTPSSRPYEEQQRTPPPPAPALSWMDRLMLQRGTNRPSKSMNPHRKGILNNKVTTRQKESQQNLRSYQLQNMFQPKAIQQVDQQLQPLYQQPVVLGFDSNVQMSERFDTQEIVRPTPSLHGQQHEMQANSSESSYSGIDHWSQANWHSPSLVSDWNQQHSRQMTPSTKILPVLSVPQYANSEDVEKWPHHEEKVQSHNRFEEIPPPVFDEDKQHGIIIQPRYEH